MFANQFDVRVLTDDVEKARYYQLRYQIYCEKFGWMEPNPFKMEMDEYDQYAEFSVGAFLRDGNQMVAGHRCLRYSKDPNKPFMFQREYEGVFADVETKTGGNVAEFSRWVIHDNFVKALVSEKLWATGPTMHLFKQDFIESKLRNLRYMYTHSYPVVIKAFNKRGFPVRGVAKRELSNGDQVELALMDWVEFEERNQGTALLRWFYESSELVDNHTLPIAV